MLELLRVIFSHIRGLDNAWLLRESFHQHQSLAASQMLWHDWWWTGSLLSDIPTVRDDTYTAQCTYCIDQQWRAEVRVFRVASVQVM